MRETISRASTVRVNIVVHGAPMIYSITLEEFSIKFLLQSENKLHHKVMLLLSLSLPQLTLGIIERYASLARGNDLSLSGLPSEITYKGLLLSYRVSCQVEKRIRAHAVHLCVCVVKAFYYICALSY